jgi:hypothetical protein
MAPTVRSLLRTGVLMRTGWRASSAGRDWADQAMIQNAA